MPAPSKILPVVNRFMLLLLSRFSQ